jgi:hypothetical protein
MVTHENVVAAESALAEAKTQYQADEMSIDEYNRIKREVVSIRREYREQEVQAGNRSAFSSPVTSKE